ncbi:MAG: hypothetical protein AB7O97_11265 [Planctomycetota bacterium]
MSRDEHDIDEPEQNDGEHLAGNESDDGLDQLFEQDPARGAAKKKPADGDAEPDSDDLLFQAGDPEAAGSEQFGERQQFSDESRGKWGGHSMSADEIGIPVESEPGFMSSDDDLGFDGDEELQLVDDESLLESAAAQADEEPTLEGDAAYDEAYEGDETYAEQPAAAGLQEEEFAIYEDDEQLDARPDGAELGYDPDQASDEDLVLDEGEVLGESLEVETEDVVGDSEFFVLDEGEHSGQLLADEPLPADSYPVEEGWEPVGAEGDASDESWMEPEPAAEPVAGGVEDLALVTADGTGEFDEQYYEESGPEVVAAAPRTHGRVLRMLSSLAAAVMVVGAGAVVVLRPEWLGLHFEPQLVERVQVARPSIDLQVPAPPLPAPPQVTTPGHTGDPVTPPVQVVQNDPNQLPIPVEPVDRETPVDPDPIPTPGTGDPVAVGDPTPRPTQPQALPQQELPRFLPAGDSLWVGTLDPREREVGDWANVRLGGKAFAQLYNGNFFIGSVKAVASDALILKVAAGEVTLRRDELEKVTTLDSDDYAELQRATTGFLKLSNQNRLVGAILKSVVDDNYVLQMRSDRIVVPKSAVEKVVEQPGVDNLRFGTANDEEQWLRAVATRQLQAMSTGVAAPGGETGVPSGGGRPLPIREDKRRAPQDR